MARLWMAMALPWMTMDDRSKMTVIRGVAIDDHGIVINDYNMIVSDHGITVDDHGMAMVMRVMVIDDHGWQWNGHE